MHITQIAENIFECKDETTTVPVRVFATESIFKTIQADLSLIQAFHVAQLPGIVGASLLMPDAHQGYGFAIGGVAAFDEQKGIISPGGIGFDINCGVRLMATNLTKEELLKKLPDVLDEILKNVPVGKGEESAEFRFTHDELDEVMEKGLLWAKEKGYASEDDLERCESNGRLDAKIFCVSPKAKKRGKNHLGTLGAGNHFIELQVVDEIFDDKIAKAFRLQKDKIVVMIHSGSRGLGHQTCSEYIRKMEDEGHMPDLVDKDLMCAPIQSKVAQDYLGAMNACANFAWVNRFMMAKGVERALQNMYPEKKLAFESIYDVAHNICKKETHIVNGKEQVVYVHRKGATRAFPKEHPENVGVYKQTGHPVLIPGSMGTPSFVLVGTQKAMELTFGSTAHGSGRVMGRKVASESIDGVKVADELKNKGIFVRSPQIEKISDEAPQVYKDSEEVVSVSETTGIGKKVAKLLPLGVIKG
jgi:tRNA-splicing ligase RtcB (3'-phosphate/5'-hydroxy nucleic acid ligase)